jgi:hypothetical protein
VPTSFLENIQIIPGFMPRVKSAFHLHAYCISMSCTFWNRLAILTASCIVSLPQARNTLPVPGAAHDAGLVPNTMSHSGEETPNLRLGVWV